MQTVQAADDGTITGIFIHGHDVTEQHNTEVAIRAEVAERRRAEAALQTCAILCSLGEENPRDLVRPDTWARNTPKV